MIAAATSTRIDPSECSQLAKLIDQPARGVLGKGFVELKTGALWADSFTFGIERDADLTLSAKPVACGANENCTLRLGVTLAEQTTGSDTIVELFNAWIKDVSILSLLENDFIEGCDAGILVTSHSGERALIYLTDPTEPELNRVAISDLHPIEWMQRGWTYASMNLNPEPI